MLRIALSKKSQLKSFIRKEIATITLSSYHIALGTSTYIAASKKREKGIGKLGRELSYGDRDVERLLLLNKKERKNLQLIELAINGKNYNLPIIKKETLELAFILVQKKTIKPTSNGSVLQKTLQFLSKLSNSRN